MHSHLTAALDPKKGSLADLFASAIHMPQSVPLNFFLPQVYLTLLPLEFLSSCFQPSVIAHGPLYWHQYLSILADSTLPSLVHFLLLLLCQLPFLLLLQLDGLTANQPLIDPLQSPHCFLAECLVMLAAVLELLDLPTQLGQRLASSGGKQDNDT